MSRWLAGLLTLAALLALVLLPPFNHWEQQKEDWLEARAAAADADTLSMRQMLNGLAAYYQLDNHEDRPSQLHLSLDEKDLETLTARRDAALVQGRIAGKHKRQLPAVVTVDGRRMNASIRLRGNQLDHLAGAKWSLKIQLKQGARFNGFRRFSLQAPYTRSFQSEAIIADAMRHFGILAPRIDYVDLVINGEPIGIMQMAEEFDTPLLESQGRRFGPLLQLDDSHIWDLVQTTRRYAEEQRNEKNNRTDRLDLQAWWSLYDNWRAADPDAYGKYRKRKKREDLDAALSQWAAFADRRVSASQVLDIDAFVDFYIICEYFSAHNLSSWSNARLHYNTLSARFEPIAYDADLDYKPMRREPLACLNPRNELARTLMQEPVFAAQWVERIGVLSKIIASDQFASMIARRDHYYRRKLAADYPKLPAFDLTPIQRQCERLCGLNRNDFALPITGSKPLPKSNRIPLDELPPVVVAYLGQDEHGAFLSLRSRIHADVVVHSLAFANPINEQLVPLVGHGARVATPFKVNSTSGRAPGAGSGTRIDVTGADITLDDTLSLQLEVKGLGKQRAELKPVPLPQQSAMPRASTTEMLVQRYPFMTVDKPNNQLQIASGQWQIDELLILPRDTGLLIDAGTELLFAPGAGLVLNGNLTVSGTMATPVAFDGIDEEAGWYGIFSHGVDHQVSISHATFNATRGFEMPGWRQPAGLLFHRANVALENVAISDSCADDAINLIRSKVIINNVQINNSCTDAIDIDASTGTLSALQLQKAGGDLLDISDSTVSLADSAFSGAGDKGISVGEQSDVTIADITVSDSAIGLAVKDLSDVSISKAQLTSLDIGLMAFQKKAEYGPAVLQGYELQIDAGQRYVLENGSSIALDEEELPATPFDLSDHY